MTDLLVPTRDDIMQWYLRDIRSGIPGANTATNSDAWVRANALADVVLPLYANALALSKEVFPGTASAAGLKLFGTTYGVPKLGTYNASGAVTVTSTIPTTIFAGADLTNTSTGAAYKTVSDTIIGAGLTATAFVVALDSGVGGNAEPGTILNFSSPPAGVSSIATVLSISSGAAAWTDSRWRKEILKRLRHAPRAANIAHLIEIGLTIPGIEQVFVYPSLRGRGTNDVAITVSAATGARVAGTSLLTQYIAAIQGGAKAQDGTFLPGIPEDVFENTGVHAVVEQDTDVVVGFTASALNSFAAWPPHGTGFVIPTDETTWYKVSVLGLNSFSVASPASGTVVVPVAGNVIGMFFPSVGFAKATILGVVAFGGGWNITVDSWKSTPTENAILVGSVVHPWCSQLTLIAGPPTTGSLALSGSVPDYFSLLGPGEMTPLTSTDTTRRRRWPRTTDTDPLTGLVEWPSDVTARLASAIADSTDAADLTVAVRTGFTKTPSVPVASYIGTSPSILTLGNVIVIPT